MRYFLISLLLITTGCSMKSFVRTGYAPYCLVDYKSKVVQCTYANMHDCREQYQIVQAAICFPSSEIKHEVSK
jgi:hypothetical protein